MTHDRPYRKAVSKEEAIREIEKCIGTQFDPRLGHLFVQTVSSRQAE
jgi:HD-GYP domain-containing protein (c-di-GMP phosphodiesterase class II)